MAQDPGSWPHGRRGQFFLIKRIFPELSQDAGANNAGEEKEHAVNATRTTIDTAGDELCKTHDRPVQETIEQVRYHLPG
jgi:hypothetical protein